MGRKDLGSVSSLFSILERWLLLHSCSFLLCSPKQSCIWLFPEDGVGFPLALFVEGPEISRLLLVICRAGRFYSPLQLLLSEIFLSNVPIIFVCVIGVFHCWVAFVVCFTTWEVCFMKQKSMLLFPFHVAPIWRHYGVHSQLWPWLCEIWRLQEWNYLNWLEDPLDIWG